MEENIQYIWKVKEITYDLNHDLTFYGRQQSIVYATV